MTPKLDRDFNRWTCTRIENEKNDCNSNFMFYTEYCPVITKMCMCFVKMWVFIQVPINKFNHIIQLQYYSIFANIGADTYSCQMMMATKIQNSWNNRNQDHSMNRFSCSQCSYLYCEY